MVGVVVVVVVEVVGDSASCWTDCSRVLDEAALDWLSSSSTSLASSALRVDSSEDTDSLSAVVSRVPSVWPAVTCWPGVAVTVVTWPPTWKEAAASLTGSTVPTTVSVVPISARVTRGHAIAGAAAAHLGPGGHAAAQDDDEHHRADQDGAPVAGAAPARAGRVLGTAAATTGPPPAAATEEPPPPPPPAKPPVHVPPPVEVIRTVVAVTAPLLAAGPNALTQSPTARAVDVAVCVALTGVELDVVILRVSVLGGVGFLLFELFELRSLRRSRPRRSCPADKSMPDTVTVEPLTPVTLPDAMAIDASSCGSCRARIRRSGSSGVPLEPLHAGKPAAAGAETRNRLPPVRPAPPVAVRGRRRCTIRVELGVVTVMRARRDGGLRTLRRRCPWP